MAQKRARDVDADIDMADKTSTLAKRATLEGSALGALLSKTEPVDLDAEDFRVIVGTYERLLYGINCYWETIDDKPHIRTHLVFVVPAHLGLIRTVAVGGHFLASGSTDEIIRLYNVKKRKEYGSLGGHQQGDITDIQFFGKYMFTASADNTICLWRTKDWEYLKTLKGHKARVNSFAVHPSGKLAMSVSADKTVILWNLMTAHKSSVNKLKDEGQVVLWNPAGDHYAILFDRSIIVYRVKDAQSEATITHRSRFLCMVYVHIESSGKDYLVTGGEDKMVRVWDAAQGEVVAELAGHTTRVKSLSLITSKDTRVLVSASSDGKIKCWDLQKVLASEPALLGEHDIKCRITCATVHEGFEKDDEA